jgi:hypothetical protein
MRDYDDYDDDNIRLYTPVFQRVIILAAVIIAVPILMWTITTFVRSYVARPQLPALEHVASPNTPTLAPTISAGPPSAAPAEQSATQRVAAASASDASNPPAEVKIGAPHLTSLPDASPVPNATNSPASLQATPPPTLAIPATTAIDGASTANQASAPVASLPRSSQRPSAPSSSDRGIAWPNPNATSPPDFTAPRLSSPPPPPPRTAAAEVLPAAEPIRGPVPMPRQRPGTFAVAAAASGPVPLPRARPADAPAEAANSANEPASGHRPGSDADR